MEGAEGAGGAAGQGVTIPCVADGGGRAAEASGVTDGVSWSSWAGGEPDGPVPTAQCAQQRWELWDQAKLRARLPLHPGFSIVQENQQSESPGAVSSLALPHLWDLTVGPAGSWSHIVILFLSLQRG